MTDTLALCRPLPHVSLQTGHWRDISSANRPTGSVDPEPPLVDLPSDAYRGALLGAGLIPQFVDAYIQFWDIVKAGYAAGISPAVEQMTGKKPRSLNTGRATTLDGGHPQFVRFVCVSHPQLRPLMFRMHHLETFATIFIGDSNRRNQSCNLDRGPCRKRRLEVAVLDGDDGRRLGGEVRFPLRKPR